MLTELAAHLACAARPKVGVSSLFKREVKELSTPGREAEGKSEPVIPLRSVTSDLSHDD